MNCNDKKETGLPGPDQKIYRKRSLSRVFRPGDFILTGIILIICFLLWGRMFTGFAVGKEAREAEIVVGGNPVMRVELETGKIKDDGADNAVIGGKMSSRRDTDGNLLVQVLSNGISVEILFQNGTVRFSESSCPDQICVRTGALSENGQVAACVPADVLVRIRGTAQKGDVDVIIR